jgi:hypothetical protein
MPIPGYLPRPIAERLARLSYAQVFEIFLRSLDVANRAIAEYRLEVDSPEVTIRPAVSHISLLQRVDVREVAALGDKAVEAALPELRRETAWGRQLSRVLFGARN